MKRVPPLRPIAQRGFTLIELLVVITIIAMLAAGAYGAYSIMIEKAKKMEAMTTGVAILTAINNFEADYDRRPLPTSGTKGTDVETDTSSQEGLITILKGADTVQNPRGVDYLNQIKEAQSVGDKRVSGIHYDSDDAISLYDSWGSFYQISLDLDGDGKVANPDQRDSSAARPVLDTPAAIFSPGKDTHIDTWKDNVSSWNP